MQYNTIIFDIDGTAINSPEQKIPSPRLITAIEKLKSTYRVCSATGRVWSFAKSVLKDLKLTDPCIISAGTQICDPISGKILWQKFIDKMALKQAIMLFQQQPEYKLLFNDATENDYLFGGIPPLSIAIHEPVYFLEQIFVPDSIALACYKKLNTIEGIACVMVCSQKPGCRDLHIVNKSATKEHAVNELIKILGVDKNNVIGIGDGHNDIHLFNAVKYKVAMGNAAPELSTLADKIIGSVKDDGLAEYLESFDI
jgi:HAD superfamily hydrolase (TIGR01484 family)